MCVIEGLVGNATGMIKSLKPTFAISTSRRIRVCSIVVLCLTILPGCNTGEEELPSPTLIPVTALPTNTPPTSTPPFTPTVEAAAPTLTPEDLILDFFETWNKSVISGEVDELLGFFAENATLETVDYHHLVSTGREEIRTALEYWTSFGYHHLIDLYELSGDGDVYYWNLESDDEKAFCHGKVILRGSEFVYLGYSTC